MNWTHWVWADGWRVLACYDTKEEALAAAKHAADPPETWVVTKRDSAAYHHMCANVTVQTARRQARALNRIYRD